MKLNNLQSSNSEKLTTDTRISMVQWNDNNGGYLIFTIDGKKLKVIGTWDNN